MNDGTFRRSYFDLVQRGDTITGTIRTTQFFFDIVESSWDSTGFTITGVDAGRRERASRRRFTVASSATRCTCFPSGGQRRTPPPATVPATPTTARDTAAARPQPELVAHRVARGRGSDAGEEAAPGAASRAATTASRELRRWDGTAGTSSPAGSPTPTCAPWPTRWRATACARPATCTSTSTTRGRATSATRSGNITTNSKFPDMKALADYVHSKGLKLGIYSSPGPDDVRRLHRQLRPRGAGRADLRRVGDRLPQVRLVRGAHAVPRRGHARGLSDHGRRAARDRPADRLQPLPVRPARRLEVGRRRRRQLVAHDGRHP